MTEIKIIEVDHCIANNFGNYIEINKHLKLENPKLYYSILKHELGHTNQKGFTTADFMHDISENINTFQLLKFMIRHPKSFLQLMPIYRYNKEWIYDINMIIIWSILTFLIFGSIFIAFSI